METLDAEAETAAKALSSRVAVMVGELPTSVPNPENASTSAKIDLGRMLYYEPRLSKNHEISCNSCHLLDRWGVDNEPTSPGHRGARGDRNSPTVYNAALHIAQFWDGREPDVEAQAKGPVLNPVEMAALSEADVVNVLKSIPGYVDAFGMAFPRESDPVTYDNMAKSIGGSEANRYEFKVPSLRNVAETGPYFHDGSVATLSDAVKIMGYHQLGLSLDESQTADLVAFLESLTGELPLEYIAKPKLPENGPNTPAPDPS